MRTRVVFAAVLCAALLAPAAARADADPASDVLFALSLFLPYEDEPSPPVEAELNAAIQHAAKIGRPVRVAIIASPTDLGGVPELFGKPADYTQFLASELQFVYSGRLLVVMPQGAGYAKGGRLIANKAVVDARPGPGGDRLGRAAIELVKVLSEADSETDSPPSATAMTATTITVANQAEANPNGGLGPLVIVLIAVAVVALAGGGYCVVRRARRG